MKKALVQSLKWVIPWSLWSFVLVLPHLYQTGTNVVTRTYHFGALNLFQGISPYGFLGENTDTFKYSPFFGYFYFPFTLLNSSGEAILFGALNCLLFWWGFFVWISGWKKKFWVIFFGALLASMELDGSLRYQQVNGALVGALLLSVWFFKEGFLKLGGGVLAVISNFKILPLAFAGSLFFAAKKKFLGSFFVLSVFAFVIPTFFLGIKKSLNFHREWLEILFKDSQVSLGILDLSSSLIRLGVNSLLSNSVKLVVFFVSVAGLIWGGSQMRKNLDSQFYGLWISLGLCFVLLVSPRTESPTYVLMGPVYLFLLDWIWTKRKLEQKNFVFLILAYVFGAFLVSISFNDLWPKSVWNPLDSNSITKSFGLFILWILTVRAMASDALELIQTFWCYGFSAEGNHSKNSDKL